MVMASPGTSNYSCWCLYFSGGGGESHLEALAPLMRCVLGGGRRAWHRWGGSLLEKRSVAVKRSRVEYESTEWKKRHEN